ncbi:atp-dependent rrna helicase rrp3 [Ophiostoma piceae UAMH 11346]|uniref:ATP-dependent rRNA helicase RRP3 n=1 Tax=Ophiostoma piceae (strain UAMH 11346) TaxID=1262450 RepID=S3BSP0_OPHP1|nr:atp-dependent rrna helicase rrp3 [Ophiostoma piceae UAMH 11346]
MACSSSRLKSFSLTSTTHSVSASARSADNVDIFLTSRLAAGSGTINALSNQAHTNRYKMTPLDAGRPAKKTKVDKSVKGSKPAKAEKTKTEKTQPKEKTTATKLKADKPSKKEAKKEVKDVKEVKEVEEVEDDEVEAGSVIGEDDEDVDDEAEAAEGAVKSEEPKTFKELGVVDVLCEICNTLNFTTPTPIQAQAIPVALQDRDIIGTAETGSGKTLAFALPILQALLDKPRPFFGLVLAPTRELAVQISQTFDAFASIALRCTVLVGGMDMVPQTIALGKRPHVIVATPGRLLEHLQKTKGFSLRSLRYLVIDEADRMLDMDFGPVFEKILPFLPRETRRTMLFSATMSSKVESLQRASLRDPVRVAVRSHLLADGEGDGEGQTVRTLKQSMWLVPLKAKDTALVYLMNEYNGRSIIVFTRTIYETHRLSILLRALGFGAIPLNGKLSQSARLAALNKIKSGGRDILIATDVAARGLDIPRINIVINFDVPQDSKTYVHRVGRTARAGKSGHAINLVTQYDSFHFLAIEKAIGMERKITPLPVDKEEMMVFHERVEEAQRYAKAGMREWQEKQALAGKGGKRKRAGANVIGGRDDMDREEM